jgi:5,5'-dehydrodivanillate O-demethylase
VWEPQDRPVEYEYQWKDAEGRFITDYVEGQDVMAWVSQGAINDRTQEHLGRSDAGVAMLRKMFKENIKKVADGQDPIAIIREKHDVIELPCEKNKFGAERVFARQWITGQQGAILVEPTADGLRVTAERDDGPWYRRSGDWWRPKRWFDQ